MAGNIFGLSLTKYVIAKELPCSGLSTKATVWGVDGKMLAKDRKR